MYRKACCMMALLLLTTIAYNQQKSYPHTLLWQISGKGLTHPSYLYGTMHLTDKRLFNFGDSVYRAIEKSEGLAIELNPDELVAYIVNNAMDQVEGKKVSEILNRKDYQKYSPALEKKFKKPVGKITTTDIVREKHKWLDEYLQKGEMSTFMDAYLCNIARRLGKWVGGVEDLSDQSGLLEELVDKSDIDYLLADDGSDIKQATNRTLERMISLYTDQDLSGIEAMSGDAEGDEKDLMLIKRNVKMARRIDSLTALRTMFIAIGAAHLPGDSGVIHLLQERGFTVTPVFSSKKVNANDYTVKEIHVPWIETEDPEGFYKISMPGNAATLKPFGLMDMKFYFDLFNLSGYCSMVAVNPGTTGSKDTVLDAIARRMYETDVVTSKKVFCDGIEGREYINTRQGQYMRVQAFLYDKMIYLVYVFSPKKEPLTAADANKFFSSFIINKTKQATTSSYTFTDSIMGVTVTSPARLTYNKSLSNDLQGWHVTGFSGTDVANGAYIMLFSKDVQPTHTIVNDSVVYSQLKTSLSAQYADIQTKEINIDGYSGMRFQGRNTIQSNIYLDGISIIKHNRNIALFLIGDSAYIQSTGSQNVIASLHLIDPPAVKWKEYTTNDSAASAIVPGAFRINDGESFHYEYAFDTTTASSYYIVCDTLNKYTWYKSDSIFWSISVLRYLGDYDLEKETDIQIDGAPGKELLIKQGNLYKKMRLILHNDKLYEIFASGDKQLVLSNNTTDFFNSFKIHAPLKEKDFITRSKTAMLLHDLCDKDSLIREGASDHLYYKAAFDKADIPLLHEALIKQYDAYFDPITSGNINEHIATALGGLQDSSAIDFIKEKYPTFVKEKEPLKGPALTTLAHIHTKESYATLISLINQYGAPKATLDYYFFNGLKDSLALTTTIFPDLQKLVKDSAQAILIARLALRLKDSGFIKQEQLTPGDYINAARKLLPSVKDSDDYNYEAMELLALLGSFKTKEANNVLKSYLVVKDKYLKEKAVKQLVINNQPVSPVALTSLAADKRIRLLLYNDLKDLKKTALFPQQYLTRLHFAESNLFKAASDDDEPVKMNFIATKTGNYQGKPYVFYLYKIVYDGEDGGTAYLGIAGGYKAGSTGVETATDLTGIYWQEAFDATKINAQFNKYLKGLK